MPGSIVTAPALENSTSSDQTHLSGLCGIFGADGLDSKVAASLAVSTREAPVNVVAHTGENGNSESPNDGSMAEAHKDENGHAESCREHAKAVSEINTHTVEAAVEQKPSKVRAFCFCFIMLLDFCHCGRLCVDLFIHDFGLHSEEEQLVGQGWREAGSAPEAASSLVF